jgi:hypothetical protein
MKRIHILYDIFVIFTIKHNSPFFISLFFLSSHTPFLYFFLTTKYTLISKKKLKIKHNFSKPQFWTRNSWSISFSIDTMWANLKKRKLKVQLLSFVTVSFLLKRHCSLLSPFHLFLCFLHGGNFLQLIIQKDTYLKIF